VNRHFGVFVKEAFYGTEILARDCGKDIPDHFQFGLGSRPGLAFF
jgi:hypothetical protein